MNANQPGNGIVWRMFKILALFLVVFLALGNFLPSLENTVSAQTVSQPSHNVAIVDSVTVKNGGSFPTTTTGPTGSFSDFHFFILPKANLSLASLGPGGVCGAEGCDTVLLNVASTGISCNLNSLTAQQKADLVSFVNSGRKLIIYDSECVTQDYSWLPYPFTTVNPGALGAHGTLTIVEENTLSSSDLNSPYYINAGALGTQTDAVGDMNVMTTFDPNWFLDMSGTNAIGFTGPVHTYATLPPGTDAGLIIYNGLDMDFMRTTTIPDSATPAGNLAKIWLQELQQLFNPSDLPGTNPVIGIALSPEDATLTTGQAHTVTATLTDLVGNPQPGIQVSFSVTSGPNAGISGLCDPIDCKSNSDGQVTFTYIGFGGVGTDQIKGCFTNEQNQTFCSQSVDAEWILGGPCDGGGSLVGIDFTGGFPPVSVTFSRFLYTEKISYSLGLTGKICPETPIALTPGIDPSLTIRSKAGELIMHETGLFETKIPIFEDKVFIDYSVLPNPPTLTIDYAVEYGVSGSDFELEEESQTSYSYISKPPRFSPAYLLYVGIMGAVLVGLVFIPEPASKAALLALLVLYIGPLKPRLQTTTNSDIALLNYQMEILPPTQSVLDGLTSVLGPEFMSFATVDTLTVDSEQKAPGQNITINGSNFVPEGYVYLFLTSLNDQNSAIEAEILADSDGKINGQIQLPTDASPGEWLLTAVDVQSIYYALDDYANGKLTTLNYFLAANLVTIPDYDPVSIDVKPGEYPNAINPQAKGVIPVAVLSTPAFDATQVDPYSANFGPDGASENHKKKEFSNITHITDVDGDGDLDMVLHFATQKSGIEPGDTQVCLVGLTKSGQSVVGCDDIVTVPSE